MGNVYTALVQRACSMQAVCMQHAISIVAACMQRAIHTIRLCQDPPILPYSPLMSPCPVGNPGSVIAIESVRSKPNLCHTCQYGRKKRWPPRGSASFASHRIPFEQISGSATGWSDRLFLEIISPD